MKSGFLSSDVQAERMEWGSAAQDTQSEAEKRQLAAQEERLRRHHMQVM